MAGQTPVRPTTSFRTEDGNASLLAEIAARGRHDARLAFGAVVRAATNLRRDGPGRVIAVTLLSHGPNADWFLWKMVRDVNEPAWARGGYTLIDPRSDAYEHAFYTAFDEDLLACRPYHPDFAALLTANPEAAVWEAALASFEPAPRWKRWLRSLAAAH